MKVLDFVKLGGPERTGLSPSHKANLPGAGNFHVPVSAGVVDLCAVCKALGPAVTHDTVTMTRRKIMRRDFWDKLDCELFGGRWRCEGRSLPALRLLIAHYNGGAVLVGMDFVLRPLAVAEQHQIAKGNHLRIPHIRLWTAKTVKGGVIMDRRGGCERSGVALQNCTTRRLL